MAINLVTQFLPHVDEMFYTESKKSLLTNQDFSWTGAHTVKVHKVNTVSMNDYDRAGSGSNDSRYGALGSVGNTLEEFTLKKDRSFTFVVDKMDRDETGGVLTGASALARQQREVIIPEVDKYVYGVMTAGAGTKPTAITLTKDNIYDEILKGNNALDNAEVPETERVLLITPDVYLLMKKSPDIMMVTDISEEMRLRGVIAMIDGITVIKVPSNRVDANFGFMIAHPVATVAPTKLEDYKVHSDPPGISGELVEGRIVYDAFVLDNKKKAIYYQANKPAA
ncbi:hypothetical protein EAI89_05575 [Eubacterium sp. am_0171]|uniref:Uncharacterized protein n=1 Tax=Faecalicatena contorta TaxID=39482 RepID=A0A174BYP8_9FIRM|nr:MULTISPECIES: hypothetical protein [Clostridia]MSC83180.1 hypothetical protein [Eubacterium sp. BIOML-A1]MSD05668.1 hypothetical protein [Eubacterium sp. BIOML-A2]RYT24563.1 hypothetical protein EAI89_05575 [Eubacterium sp. am_0171]CUO04755.1 Uncharacterised protein [[Eubacterium] contortum] [Faecalicatena contorta]